MGGSLDHRDYIDRMDMGHHHHMGHHADHQMGPTRLPDGSEFYLLRLLVKEKADYSRSVPENLSEIPQLELSEADTRPITISMTTDDGDAVAHKWQDPHDGRVPHRGPKGRKGDLGDSQR